MVAAEYQAALLHATSRVLSKKPRPAESWSLMLKMSVVFDEARLARTWGLSSVASHIVASISCPLVRWRSWRTLLKPKGCPDGS
jgi:hypothetical protein